MLELLSLNCLDFSKIVINPNIAKIYKIKLVLMLSYNSAILCSFYVLILSTIKILKGKLYGIYAEKDELMFPQNLQKHVSENRPPTPQEIKVRASPKWKKKCKPSSS